MSFPAIERDRRRAGPRIVARPGVLGVCLLHLIVAVSCAKPAPQVPSPPVQAGAPAILATPLVQLQSGILAATKGRGVTRGTWGIVVHSLDRDEPLFELNAGALLVPASVAKLVSVATAVDAVGWDYRYETALRTNGVIDNGTLRGDLMVVGSGDPSIGARDGDDLDAWIEALQRAGIRRIEGRVIGDDNAVEEPRPALAWAWDDLGYPTGALFGALNYGENRTALTVTPGALPGDPARLELSPAAEGRPLVNRTVTSAQGSPLQLWPEQRPGETALTIAGTIPAGAAPARLMIAAGNPTLWFATVLRNRLRMAGIEVTGEAVDVDDVEAPAATTTLLTYRSRPLSELVGPLLKNSINLYGEAFLRLNAGPGALPTNDAALDGLRKRLAAWGVAPDGQQLMDGSGLSRRDVIAPEVLLAVLRRLHDPTGRSPWMRAMPIAGVDGSLEGRMRGTAAEGNVRAKTGTMSNIRSLAGYVTTADGERLAFVIMVNDFEGTGADALQAIDGIAVRLAGFRR